jgi:acetylornithine deacetylase/succinyl-diaminopimelate desuccinylase-like protein
MIFLEKRGSTLTERLEIYFQSQRETHLAELQRFIAIPSISSQPAYKDSLIQCAHYTADLLHHAGMEHVTVLETGGHPIIYGDWLHAPESPTVLIYGHYDVQPPEPLEAWHHPPFEPIILDGKLYGRGASDNKGQIYLHIRSLEAWLKTTGYLPVNVKFLIEGEEEIGSPRLLPYLETHLTRFQADLVVISDTAMLGENQPAVCYGLRGLAGFRIEVRGPSTDLPSGGVYGGAVQNPIHALVQLLASMRDEHGRITVDGFYEDVIPPTPQEKAALAALPFDEETMKARIQVKELFGEKGFTALERAWVRPTLEINGIVGGYYGESGKTIIPATACANVTCRLVPHQDPYKIMQQIEEHIRTHTPPGVTVTITEREAARPYVTPIDHPAIQLAASAYESAYGTRCYFIRAGGSIPVVETLSRLLQVPVVLMGFGLPDANVHGPNEYFSLDNFDKGLRTLVYYWRHLPDVWKKKSW